MSSKAPYVASIPSMMSSSPSNNEMSHVYLQGLSPMKIQVNPNTNTSSYKDLKILDPMPSCTTIPNVPTPKSHSKCFPSMQNMNTFQESSMNINNITPSLEVTPCQEDNLKNEETSPIINQDQDTKTPQSHLMIEKYPTSLESHGNPFIPFHFFQDELLPSQEQRILPNPILNPLPKQDHDASSTFSNDPIQMKSQRLFLIYPMVLFHVKSKVSIHLLVIILHIHLKDPSSLQIPLMILSFHFHLIMDSRLLSKEKCILQVKIFIKVKG